MTMSRHPTPITRRTFLRLAALGALHMALPQAVIADSDDYESFDRPPRDHGRIISWQQTVRSAPSPEARVISYVSRDDVIPLHASLRGVAPWPSNAIWYMTSGGFIHSGYVQPVETMPNTEVVKYVRTPGFWAEVCVPYVRGQWGPGTGSMTRTFYYETVYRVINAEQAEDGTWWYQLEQGITFDNPGPYVPASTMRRLSPADLAPISPGRDDKWIRVNIGTETLTCFEGDTPVFSTRTASGVYGVDTPLGEFAVLHKRHCWRMVGDDYDLPGIAFPVYLTRSGVAIHGTYWHNDYGRRHSHGCLNITSQAARWVFRWVDPIANYGETTVKAEIGEGTRIVVVS